MRQGEMAAVIDLNEDVHTLLPLTEHRPIGTLPFAGRYRLIDFPLSAITAADIHSVAYSCQNLSGQCKTTFAQGRLGIWI